ncbi:peptidase S24/S26A/S26B/S26C [Cercophora scortea]|uniref:Peptidase S24/S26A/S26B/S26C n=1 Tax=Cercophora scortea TaxID=314031 RepID=A0AAE0MD67_9PEZI|nr:peptidase S24/S26A/S26B/S26C [Cercophora scortea]
MPPRFRPSFFTSSTRPLLTPKPNSTPLQIRLTSNKPPTPPLLLSQRLHALSTRLTNRARTSASHFLGHPLRALAFALKFLAFGHLLMEYGIWPRAVAGPSMLPTIAVAGSWALIDFTHRFGRGVQVGDLVAYHIPINTQSGLKRVLGMPGDYVLVDTPETGGETMIQVPPGHCWLIGDNLDASRDSRLFGPVPLGLVRGKILAIFQPFRSFEWVKNPMLAQ